MSYIRSLRGIGSGVEYPPDAVMNLCPLDGRPVEVVIDIPRLRDEQSGLKWYHPERNDMWRFGALLPLDVSDPRDHAYIVSRGEGFTPLLDYDDHPTAVRAGFTLRVKEEGDALPGYGKNPTASFKDRGMAMAVSMAKKLGRYRLALPSQGNAGDALAEYALAAGLEAAIVMPEDTPSPILDRVNAYAREHENIRLELVKGTIREAGQLVREKYVSNGYFSVATFHEPGWRIEGKKTMGYELAEPRRRGDAWELPDVVIYPTGGGMGMLGMWKAFDELEAMGLIDGRRPRMISVQSDQTAPLVRAFERHLPDAEPVAAGRTIATGLNVPGGVGHFRVLEILYASAGAAVAVSDAALLTALRAVLADKGWRISPEGAACLAALDPLVDRGLIRPGDRVVAFNTASLDKYLPDLAPLLE